SDPATSNTTPANATGLAASTTSPSDASATGSANGPQNGSTNGLPSDARASSAGLLPGTLAAPPVRTSHSNKYGTGSLAGARGATASASLLGGRDASAGASLA